MLKDALRLQPGLAGDPVNLGDGKGQLENIMIVSDPSLLIIAQPVRGRLNLDEPELPFAVQ